MDVSRSPSKKQIRTSIISDFLVLARKLKTATLAGQPTSRRMKKAPFTMNHQMDEHEIQVECLSESIKETDQVLIFRSEPQKICFYSFG